MSFRVGFGFDVHQLKDGEDLCLGGVKLDHHKGTVGHSDADVLIHAICDALLGAANLRDIGYHFPDSDDTYKNIESKEFLTKVNALLAESHYSIGNIDCTICLQQPKISSFIPGMKKRLSSYMNISEGQVSIKATTTENLGFVGREEGVSAYAVALIEKMK